MNSEGTQLYIYMYPFSQTPLPSRLPHNTEQSSICYIPYNRSLLVIHFKYSNVYVSIPNSPTIPSLHSSLPATISSFSKTVNLFMFCKFICPPFPYFQFVTVSRSEMDLLSSFCIHPVSLCLLVDAFNLFTFMVIIDMYDPITIFLTVWGLFSASLFLLLDFLPREVPLAFVVKLVWWY